jgi:hypothetical protein
MNPPPPIGGITISVKNLIESIKNYAPHSVCHNLKEDSIFTRYDLGHVHGINLQNNFINRLSIKSCDGVVFLNDKIVKYWSGRIDKPMIKLPSLFQEGYEPSSKKKKCNDELTLLIYANSRAYKEDLEVYGVEFAIEALSKSSKKFKLIIVDISAEYEDFVLRYQDRMNIDYYSHAVDFKFLVEGCDIYLRPTSMDGSSLAIQEALISGTKVIASNVVDRENGVILYDYLDERDFLTQIFSSHQEQFDFSLKSVALYFDFIDNI